MNPPHSKHETPDQPVADQLRSSGPKPFFDEWIQAVLLAGPRHFGILHSIDVAMALNMWDLSPDVPLIEKAIGIR